MAAITDRQRIDITGLTANDIQPHADDIIGLLAVFDAALATHKLIIAEQARLRDFATATLGCSVAATPHERLGLFADKVPNAEYALRLWCSANQIDFEVDDYIHDCRRWHVVAALIDGQRFISIQKSWPLETEPRLVTDAEQMWRPERDGAA